MWSFLPLVLLFCCVPLSYSNKNQTNNLGLLIEPQSLQIKILIDVPGATLDTVLQFVCAILFSTKGHISLGVFCCALMTRDHSWLLRPKMTVWTFPSVGLHPELFVSWENCWHNIKLFAYLISFKLCWVQLIASSFPNKQLANRIPSPFFQICCVYNCKTKDSFHTIPSGITYRALTFLSRS